MWQSGPDTETWAERQIHVLADPAVHWFSDPPWPLLGSAVQPVLYLEDNLGPSRSGGDEGAIAGLAYGTDPVGDDQRASVPFAGAEVTHGSAEALLQILLPDVGATRPVRDSVDARILGEVQTNTGGIIDHQDDVPAPQLAAAAPEPDADGDGLPDAWERDRGLDPSDPTDALEDDDADGYTNLEAWLYRL